MHHKDNIKQLSSIKEIRHYLHTHLAQGLSPIERNQLAGVLALTNIIPKVEPIHAEIEHIFSGNFCDVMKIYQDYKESTI